jgi:hypothetical protein
MNRPGDERVVRVLRADLSFVRVDHQTRLQFDGTEVVIDSPFVRAGRLFPVHPAV